MPDFDRCDSKDCPLRHKCRRSISKPEHVQYYGKFEYKVVDGETYCDGYMPVADFLRNHTDYRVHRKRM